MNNLKIKVLSPLHIGDNENKKLSSLGDFIIENNYIRMINKKKLEQLFSIDEKIMEDYINQINFHSGKTYSLKPFLKDYEISIDEICSNEKIPIIGEFSGKEIHPFISENGKRYIPGSSVKGAIRNSFAYHFLKQNKSVIHNLLDDTQLTKIKKPFQKIEKQIFGRTANSDIFRFLQITDSISFQANSSVVIPANSYHIKNEKPRSPINYECIKSGSETNLRIIFKQIPQSFFKTNNALSFWIDKFSFDKLFSIINEFSIRFIERELQEIKDISTLKNTVAFYTNLKKKINDSNNKTAFLCIGKGTTIMGKTILLILSNKELCNLRNKMKNSKNARNFGWIYIKNLGKKVPSVKLPITRLSYEEDHFLNSGFGWIKMEKI